MSGQKNQVRKSGFFGFAHFFYSFGKRRGVERHYDGVGTGTHFVLSVRHGNAVLFKFVVNVFDNVVVNVPVVGGIHPAVSEKVKTA